MFFRPGHPIVHATAGFQRLTGYTRQETLGRNCNFIQGPSTLTDTIQQFSFLLASAQCGLFEIMNYRKDGTPFWNLVYVEPICDQYGLVDKFFGVQVDISDVLDRHHDRSKSKFYDDRGQQIGPIRHANAKAIADVKLLEDGSVQVVQLCLLRAIIFRLTCLRPTLVSCARSLVTDKSLI